MILAHVYKLKPSDSQSKKMNDWLNLLRAFYNFCLRDRIEAYEQVRSPIMGNYSAEIEGSCNEVQPPKNCDYLYHFLA